MTLGAGIEFVNGIRRTTPIQIAGNALDNSIRSGRGSDKISGNNGNDVLYGDSGDDTLNGGRGNDMYFRVGSTDNGLTLHNFTASTFNINGADYRISNDRLVRK